MLAAIVVSSFIIIILTFLIQVPVFSWFYRNLVKNIHIDYIYTSFWFFIIQMVISVILIIINNFINLDTVFDRLFENKTWYTNNIAILWNVVIGIMINLFFVTVLIVTLNKLVLKLKMWDNFLINFVLILILVLIVPLSFYLYLTFQSNNLRV